MEAGGGRSWSWNRTVIGGKGGNANSTETGGLGIYFDRDNDDNPKTNTNQSWDGEDGEDCGIVTISNDIKVYAYGGSGAEGGPGISGGAGGARRLSSGRYRSEAELVGGRSEPL